MDADAIIFIPGIKGTKLVETNRVNYDTIWSGIQSNFETIEDLELSFRFRNRHYDQGIENLIAAGEIEELAYAEFLNDLRTTKPIYIFGYDWRLSARDNGARLATFVDYLVAKSKAAQLADAGQKAFEKFDFITHSLGNFVLRNFIVKHDPNFSRIHKIVFVAPPFKGGLDIASVVLTGEGWFDDVKAKVRKLARTWPGALELLPTYNGASRFTTGNPKHNFFNFKHWQKNITDVNAAGSKGILAHKFKKALSMATNTVASELCDLSGLSLEKRKRILVIARVGYRTSESIQVDRNGRPQNRFNFDDRIISDGDGRVSVASSCHYWADVRTALIQKSIWNRDYSHARILKDERTQKLTSRFLNNEALGSDTLHSSIKKVTGLSAPTPDHPTWSVRTGRL